MRLMIACRAIDNMAGGVERQAIALANEMTKRGHEVSLFTLDHKDAQAFYDIESSVNWYKLGLGNPKEKAGWALRFRRMMKVRRIMKEFKPDVVLAFQHGMFLTLRLYTVRMGIPIVAAERESPFRFDFLEAGKHRQMIFQSFRLAPHITVQCESYPEAYPSYLHSKITVIPNAISPAHQFAAPEGQDNQEKILLCVGRLGYQKNQLALIDAFARVSDDYPDWRLILAGEGEGRTAIEHKIIEYGLGKKVDLLGAVKDISALYANAHVLCLPSRWEGFPNVLGEALAHGLPAVGYRGCGGVCDLIEHGKNGLLADGYEDIDTLCNALREIMKDNAARKNMGIEAIISMEPYTPQAVYNQWESFLEGTQRS